MSLSISCNHLKAFFSLQRIFKFPLDGLKRETFFEIYSKKIIDRLFIFIYYSLYEEKSFRDELRNRRKNFWIIDENNFYEYLFA